MDNQKRAYIYVSLSILLWSTVATAFKLTLAGADYLQLLFYASAASFAALLVIMAVQGDLGKLFGQKGSDYLKSAGMAAVNPLAYYCLLFKAYSILPAQEAQPLNWTWPIVIAVLSAVFLKQKLSVRSILAILVSFSGVVVIATRGDFTGIKLENWTGAGSAVSSSIFWGVFWVLNLLDKREALVKLTTNFFFGVIYTGITVALFSDFQLGNIAAYWGAVYIGLFEMGVTFVLWLKSLSLAHSSAKMAIFAYFTPFLSLIFIHFILGETIMLSSLTGLALIMGGILLIKS